MNKFFGKCLDYYIIYRQYKNSAHDTINQKKSHDYKNYI